MILDLLKSFTNGFSQGYYGDMVKDIDRRKKKLLKKYSEYPIVCDVNVGMMGDNWSYRKTNDVNQWLEENFPGQWKLLTHYSEDGFDCDVFYHFANEEIIMAFKLRWQ